MKSKTWLLVLWACSPLLANAEGAINDMALVLVGLNHFPSAEHRQSLEAIVQDAKATEDEKLLAQIIARIAHKVSSADRAKLEEILAAEATSEGVRTLAAAALNINHKVSSNDLAGLKAMSD
jgi:hypothetical protein